MSTTSGRKRTTSSGRRKTTTKKKRTDQERLISNEVLLIFIFAIGVFLFLCNFGIIGPVGDTISSVMFGIFGLLAYIAPIFVFVAMAFGISNQGNTSAIVKLGAAVTLFFTVGVILELSSGILKEMEQYSILELYHFSAQGKSGGGVIAGSLAYLLYHFLDMAGSVLVIIVIVLICMVIITGKSFIKGMREGTKKVYSTAKDDAEYRKEQAAIRREEIRRRKFEEETKRQGDESAKEVEKILRMNKKVSGVMLDTALKESSRKENIRDDIHEITLNDIPERIDNVREVVTNKAYQEEIQNIRIHSATIQQEEPSVKSEGMEEISIKKADVEPTPQKTVTRKEMPAASKEKKYVFPPVSRLKKTENGGKGTSAASLKETAMQLQQTLHTFGVNVTVTDISQGPSVTRYELQPETGVKVSKIVGLADDIKLNLAATDIRIEAPIPGKAAVGIEVPNKENSAVGLRELIESKEFKEFPSNLAFAVGKDISGHVVVADIAKMPHMLIAGATGSGKSVCINTIIMSILYKAHPDDVKLIMVDPKVVELSVYNGIPHLLIPVVTDPKKAAAALHWGVAEMTERYKKFADMNVRDLKGYNKQVQSMIDKHDPNAPEKLPQIVIIVDELADLMMVAAQEVEESICRLAQLARAAGIHLIIATQRPSVDVITGLIKANMPSRVAFAVSSGVDSRTILDMNGAEKLLGKGDMLFYPQGYTKPARIQGAFVSDSEVSDVVDFLKNQMLGNTYSDDIEEQIKNMGSGSQGGNGTSYSDGGNERDQYFVDAGRFIIEKDKASIGMLQRVFKIGFNRAARIMDQLAEAGVVGEDEGTKPRKVLMSMEQFEEYIEEYL
ncbi:MAG: DNA translocase FtsK [Lachnospiraceae bacterium]|nr:DNA translocase FtsK [Lachnospiraceae bacterium]